MLAKICKAAWLARHYGWRALGQVCLQKSGWPRARDALCAWADRRGLLPLPLTMLSPSERSWLENYARRHYTGAGAIVDLGCWLGSSTIALAHGMAERSAGSGCRLAALGTPLLHAYDRFQWEAWMDSAVVGTRLHGRYRPGDSFRDEFERQVRPWREQIDVHAGDLLGMHWTGQPIELLFIDVWKSWELANHVLREFFPCLLPGALVVHQDFVHFHPSWIVLLVWRFREFFEPVEHLERSTSVIFRCRGPVPAEMCQMRYGFESFDEDEFEAAYAYAAELVRPRRRGEMRLGRIMALIHRGELDRAAAELTPTHPGYQSIKSVPAKRWVEEELARLQARKFRKSVLA